MNKQPSKGSTTRSGPRAGHIRGVLTAPVTILVATAAASFGVLMSGSAAASSSHSGWGAESSYLGRYHLRAQSLTPAAQGPGEVTGQAAVFSAVATACRQITASSPLPKGGELTMFMREVKKGKPLVPSGILDIRSASGDELIYLTYLTSSGTSLHAKINGGAFVGPVIGSFDGRLTGSGMISAITKAEGLGTLTASYTRFSDSPQP
jgi:hypothetical protein